MYALTADQRASRRSPDLVPRALLLLERAGGDNLATAPQRNAGDEVQTLTPDARTALTLALALLRDGHWSVGIGVGDVESPTPSDVRAARGDALIRARDAVERAKQVATRIAVSAEDAVAADDVEAVMRLLVEVRDRRTERGWEVADLVEAGMSQKQAAAALGITPTAVSLRAKAAGLRAEEQAIPVLERLLARAGRVGGP
jgi:hypothetical protein